MSEDLDSRLYFRQLLAGRQVATAHPMAGRMANFMYLLGDQVSREAFVVDPAWDVDSLLAVAEADGYTVRGALVTHYHPDHVGGDLFGHSVEGLARLLEIAAVPVYVNKHEADGLKKVTGLAESDLRRVDDSDHAHIGAIDVQFLHTPGHTPGSQCFLLGNRLVAGDTHRQARQAAGGHRALSGAQLRPDAHLHHGGRADSQPLSPHPLPRRLAAADGSLRRLRHALTPRPHRR